MLTYKSKQERKMVDIFCGFFCFVFMSDNKTEVLGIKSSKIEMLRKKSKFCFMTEVKKKKKENKLEIKP